MSKVIIALFVLLFFFICFLLFWMIVFTIALLIFSRKGEKGVPLYPEIKGS